jgi:UDP-glucuronate 4-epimerase
MAILITGAAGFIGSHLVERLLSETNADLVCVDNFNDTYDPAIKRGNVGSFWQSPRVTFREVSFCDSTAMRGLFGDFPIRHVVHLGALAGVRASAASALDFQHYNVAGTLALLEAARRFRLDRFLFISSSTVYGRGSPTPFREDGPLGIPASPYGASKRSAEIFSLTYRQLHGLPVICLRPFSVYGPRMRPDLALSIFADRILNRRPIPLYGDRSIRRDFTHVSDICSGIISALGAEKGVGHAINLGCGQPVALGEVIEQLEANLGQEAIIRHRPARAEDLLETHASLDRARRLLGYSPTIPFRQGVKDFVAWFLRSRAVPPAASNQLLPIDRRRAAAVYCQAPNSRQRVAG